MGITHGSKSHREHGSTGPGATPSRVYPGVKHPGRMGGKTTTVQNLKILKVEDNYVAIAGSVPGKKEPAVHHQGERGLQPVCGTAGGGNTFFYDLSAWTGGLPG